MSYPLEGEGVYQAPWNDTYTPEECPEDPWNPWDVFFDRIIDGPGFARWGLDRMTLLLPKRGWVSPQRVSTAFGAWVEYKGGRLRVDFNPAQVTSLAIHPCPVEAVATAACQVIHQISESLPIGRYAAEEVLAAGLSRVDVARDFEEVRHGAAITDGVSRLPRLRRLRTRVYSNDRVIWMPNGVTVGTDNETSLYDRHLYYRSKASGRLSSRRPVKDSDVPEGVLRFEVRAESEWLAAAGLSRLADLTVDRALALLRHRWAWSQFGTPVLPSHGLVEAIERMGWTDRESRAHLWIEARRPPGGPIPGTARERREHRERLKAIGIASPSLHGDPVRLDLGTGREMSLSL